ncbi:MAG: hypothetical protein J0M18_15140 [Ignavibacteria bacterium]|nr:hypothetical protein [Ignavibacteria bacterium]
MSNRQYYSDRNNKTNSKLSLSELKRFFIISYGELESTGYFQKYFGYYCIDQDWVTGEIKINTEDYLYTLLKKDNLVPIRDNIVNYTEDTLFDMIEFYHDHCSKPLEGDFHSWGNCGWHYNKFDDAKGREEFRKMINPHLKKYKEGFEISEKGEILRLPESGFELLMKTPVPSKDEENINEKIENAKSKYRKHNSTLADRKEAVRELADILEFLRPKAQDLLKTKDENDLFNVIQNFGVRHHNQMQKVNYDKNIWYSWMFYFFLSTIYAVLKLIEKNEKKLGTEEQKKRAG